MRKYYCFERVHWQFQDYKGNEDAILKFKANDGVGDFWTHLVMIGGERAWSGKIFLKLKISNHFFGIFLCNAGPFWI